MLLFSTAEAQNPTIIKGDYVSNVFGQSNFVKNPNAQTGTANISNSNATVTRSTTTPLVATTEFNWSASVGGFSTWSLRPFDEGMKNQNCEARFTYRGFTAGTTTAQIRHSGNVIAELVLTPSATDPRIASINFPCGDLSLSTNFRLLQSGATLGGINEIGGIYVGLATNMANVAQAEAVVYAKANATQTIPSNSYTRVLFGNEVTDVYGEFSSGLFTAKRAGVYLVNAQIFWEPNAGFSSGQKNIVVRKNGSVITNLGEYDQTTQYEGIPLTAQIQMNIGDTIDVAVFQNSGSNKTLYSDGFYTFINIYRFPSSSELVVTPETQNVWGGVVYTAEQQILFSGTADPTAYASYNDATWNKPAKLVGKAQVTTTNGGNDLGFSIPNLPVGNYKIETSGLIGAVNRGSTNTNAAIQCNFRIVETDASGTVRTEIARQAHQDFSLTSASNDETRDWINSFHGVYNNTSVATRNFRLEAQKFTDTTSGNIGVCQAFSQTVTNGLNSNITITLTPLDNNANSALYVQGPVKAAGTGTAIPAGYVGEIVPAVGSTLGVTAGAGGSYRTGTGITLQPGVWEIEMRANMGGTAPTTITVGITTSTNGSPILDSRNFPTDKTILDAGNTCCVMYGYSRGIFNVTTATQYFPTVIGYPAGASFNFTWTITATRIN